MRSLNEIRGHRERLEREVGQLLDEEKQAEAAAAQPLHPAQLLAQVAASACEAYETGKAERNTKLLRAFEPQDVLPQGDAERKRAPMYRGLLGYFPLALFRVAEHSMISDRKHNPETPESEAPHWARQKSTDHADCIVRHLCEMHTNPDYHLKAIAWRALALLQEHEEKKGAAMGASAVVR